MNYAKKIEIVYVKDAFYGNNHNYYYKLTWYCQEKNATYLRASCTYPEQRLHDSYSRYFSRIILLSI